VGKNPATTKNVIFCVLQNAIFIACKKKFAFAQFFWLLFGLLFKVEFMRG
jgi:hypothetical protein